MIVNTVFSPWCKWLGTGSESKQCQSQGNWCQTFFGKGRALQIVCNSFYTWLRSQLISIRLYSKNGKAWAATAIDIIVYYTTCFEFFDVLSVNTRIPYLRCYLSAEVARYPGSKTLPLAKTKIRNHSLWIWSYCNVRRPISAQCKEQKLLISTFMFRKQMALTW